MSKERKNPNPLWHEQLRAMIGRESGNVSLRRQFIAECLGVSIHRVSSWQPNDPKDFCPDDRQVQISELYEKYLVLEETIDSWKSSNRLCWECKQPLEVGFIRHNKALYCAKCYEEVREDQ